MDLAPYIFQQYFEDDGTPLNAGTITAYEAGTLNLKDTYTTAAGNIPNSNPFTLAADGRTTFYLESGSYDFVIKDSGGNTLDTKEDVLGSGTSGSNSSQSVETIAELTALVSGSSDYVDVGGYFANGDGGGGRFYWDATSSSATDGGVILSPDSSPAQGRWVRIYNNDVYPEWWGIDGTEDNVQIQQAIDYLAGLTNPGGRVLLGPKTYNTVLAITLRPFINLQGSNEHETIISHTGSSNIIQATTGGSSTTSAKITDMDLQGDTTNSLVGLNLHQSTNDIAYIECRNVRISGCVGNGVDIVGIRNSSFKNMTIATCLNGFRIDLSADTSTSCIMDNVYCNNCLDAGFSVDGNGIVHELTFLNCYAETNAGNGFEILGTVSKYNIHLIGCRSENDGNHGVHFQEVVGTLQGWYATNPTNDSIHIDTGGEVTVINSFFPGDIGGNDIDYSAANLYIINCLGLSRDDITGTIPIRYWDENETIPFDVTQASSPFTVQLWDNGRTFTNIGASSTVEFDLPALDASSKVGFRCSFIARETQPLDIDPASGDRILPGTISSGNKLTCSTGQSARIDLVSVDQTIWSAGKVDSKWFDGDQNQLFSDGDTTPDVRGSTVYTTQNTVSTVISNLDNGYKGQIVSIFINDDNTSFTSAGNFKGNGGLSWRPITGDIVRAEFDGTNWHLIPSVLRNVRSGLTASTTQTQGQEPLTGNTNEVATVANANDTVTMPSCQTALQIEIRNNGANTLQIFPASGDDIDGNGVNTAVTLATSTSVIYKGLDGTNWMTV